MKKKTVIVLSSVVFTILLFGILCYRGYLLTNDTSGFYELQTNDWFIKSMTFMPEIAIVTTLIAIFAKNKAGVLFTVLSVILSLIAFCSELFIKFIRIASNGVVPSSCIPWLDIPVLLLAIALFVLKFHIYTLPSEIKIKLKLVNIC